MVQKLHCYREQTKAEVYLKKIIVRNGWKSAQGMWWKLCQVVVPCVQQTSVLAMQKPFLGLHQVKTPLCWKHHFTEPPQCCMKVAAFRTSNLSSSEPNLSGHPGEPHTTALLKNHKGCFCVPEHPLLPHTIALPQLKNHECNPVSSYTFSFCCLFSLLYTTASGVILVPSDTALHQPQTHQVQGKTHRLVKRGDPFPEGQVSVVMG